MQLAARIPPKLYAWLESYAERNNCSRSFAIQKLIEFGMRAEEAQEVRSRKKK